MARRVFPFVEVVTWRVYRTRGGPDAPARTRGGAAAMASGVRAGCPLWDSRAYRNLVMPGTATSLFGGSSVHASRFGISSSWLL